ncbi:hypothetical protein TIFTF001_038043 [Ficus carica]|uniref:Uncharacterized protein n=1 Tax=Ficus carica TaxID=3494 RepID=A0AA88E7A3_FICCA|nr:hypothetical protein TIFTF001_038043 [Ficus carica]
MEKGGEKRGHLSRDGFVHEEGGGGEKRRLRAWRTEDLGEWHVWGGKRAQQQARR